MIRVFQATISYPEEKWGKPEDRARNTPLMDFVDELPAVGADGIELWGRHLDGLDEAAAKALAGRISSTGQSVEVLSPYWDFSSSDEAVETSLTDAERFLKLKDVFGAKMIRVFVGAPASAEATEENWSRATAGLKRLARMYDGTGVTFVVETHGDQLPDTPETAARLMKELDEPSILLNYQRMGGPAAEELDLIYQWVAHVHVSPVARFKDPVEATIAELVARGYDKAVTVEFCTNSLTEEGVKFDRGKAMAGMKSDVARLKALIAR